MRLDHWFMFCRMTRGVRLRSAIVFAFPVRQRIPRHGRGYRRNHGGRAKPNWQAPHSLHSPGHASHPPACNGRVQRSVHDLDGIRRQNTRRGTKKVTFDSLTELFA
jgi:hypothetical protein